VPLALGLTAFMSLALAAAPATDAGPTSTERQAFRDALRRRPDDLWPRGEGHVLLAWPGSPTDLKGYHEPGGSFSPGAPSFGLSIWIVGPDGSLLTTSDSVPRDRLQQRFTWSSLAVLPAITTTTALYSTTWSTPAPGRWLMELGLEGEAQAILVVRSVGPAGGPITSLEWTGRRLNVNRRWSLTFEPAPMAVLLSHEGLSGWRTLRSSSTHWEGQTGWGVARLELDTRRRHRVVIEDSRPAPALPARILSARSGVNLTLSETTFGDSLDAQVAHLLMGLVDRETRPADPLQEPLNRLRDGAYVLAALARVGQIDTARALAASFAAQDFFGGFGSEADAPGLALWALGEVAARAHSHAYDRELWPHVERKADLILRMQSAGPGPLRLPWVGPALPSLRQDPDLDLVCGPAREGLIEGRTGLGRPLLFIAAVSARGLTSAAEVADRLGEEASATRWRAAADRLRQAWRKAFVTPESEAVLTLASGIWPTGAGSSDRTAFRQALLQHSAALGAAQGAAAAPSHLDAALAHQWVLLDEPGRVRSALDRLWGHQESAGLFTYAAGAAEESPFGGWDGIRGWARPQPPTPAYWTAAEIALLQLDMLAYLDGSGDTPTLVVGGGVPQQWLSQPFAVSGVWTRAGEVAWSWGAGRVTVTLRGARLPVRLGAVFPATTPVDLHSAE
jgi:hypothetical protein